MVVALLALLFSFSKGQNSKQDSLLGVIAKNKGDTFQVQAFLELAWIYFRQSDYSQANGYARQARELANKLKYPKGIASSYNIEGVVFCDQGDYLHSAEKFMASLEINEKRNDLKSVASVNGNLGIVHMYMENFGKASEYYRKSYDASVKRKDSQGMIRALLNIGLMHRQEGKTNDALDYYNRSLVLMDSVGFEDAKGHAYLNMGNIYEDLAESTTDEEKVRAYNQEAEHLYMRALPLAEERNDGYSICHLHGSLGSVHLRANRYREAEDMIRKAFEIEKEIGSATLQVFLHEVYFKLLESKGDHKNALIHFRKFKQLSDTMKAEEKRKALVEKDLRYSYEKREAELRAEQARKEEVDRIRQGRERLVRNIVGAALIVTLIFTLVIFNRFRVTRRQKEVIAAQKQLVEVKNREINDSIQYAKHVQKSIMPAEQHFREKFTSYFIYYRPKDIVAGDFYWLETVDEGTDELVMVAAADATGHGVPGALVSVVCSSALHRAVYESGCRLPGEVLDKTSQLVQQTFVKGETGIRDGMDVSLLTLDKRKSMVHWSGANNSLFYTDKGKLTEIHGDKQPVGRSDSSKPFHTHEIPLVAGMTFYLFTDGFADQFGGPFGKKYKHKQLREFLGKISSDSMKNQKEAIGKAFDSWKGNLEQVDDVCVIGLRV
jgi:serine phosphatase RsbU (regulator of sigma subunit)/Tfp pilus assembly protein PilF